MKEDPGLYLGDGAAVVDIPDTVDTKLKVTESNKL